MTCAVVLLASLGLATLAQVHAQGFNYGPIPATAPASCVTPQGEEGECVLLKDCAHLFRLFRQSRTVETRRYLEQFTCTQVGRYSQVCCAHNSVGEPSVPRPVPRLTPRPTPRPTFRPAPRPTPGQNNRLVPTPRPAPRPEVSMMPLVEAVTPFSTSSQGALLQHQNINLLPLDSCGEDFVSKIYGGNDTTPQEFPWAALLQFEKNGVRSFQCGGALISRRYVLTAAHCTNKGTIGMSRLVGVRLGEYDVEKNPDCEPDEICKLSRNCPDICADEPIDFGIEEQIVHPQYRSRNQNQHNDIALLRLDADAPFTGYIRPICIPTDDSLARKSYMGTSLTATGWGRATSGTKSPVKLKADLPAVSNEECAQLYAKSRRNVTSSQMCAGGVEGVDVCSGDSGGPLMSPEDLNNRKRYHVMGIVSYGSTSCHFGIPGVYTRVAAYSRWILDQLRS